MRIAVYGGTGFVGSHVCKTLITCGCAVTSISRGGDPTLPDAGRAGERFVKRFANEQWIQQVDWKSLDAADEAAAASALAGGPPFVDGVVSCIGTGDLLKASADGWNSRWAWSEESRRLYQENFEPTKAAVAAAQAAGAKRFVYVGASSEAQRGFGGPNPGLFTGKRAAALAARDAFGDGFVFFGPHAVVEKKDDPQIKFLSGGVGKGLSAVNDFFGEVRSFGPDYAQKTRLTPPVLVSDLATAITASVVGKVEVAETVRRAGVTVEDAVRESEQYEIEDKMRHVDGTEEIAALARRAEAVAMSS